MRRGENVGLLGGMTMMLNGGITGFLLLLVFTSCGPRKENAGTVEVKPEEAITVTIHRYDEALSALDKKMPARGLDSLHEEYAFFIGDSYKDEVRIQQLRDYLSDPLIQELIVQTQKHYPSLDSLETELGRAFSRYAALFPGEKLPTVYTYISGLDYESPVRLVDTVMIIALDMFLGPEAPYYAQVGIPAYKRTLFSPEYICTECMRQLIYRRLNENVRDKSLLDWMVLLGKVNYALKSILPEVTDATLMAYPPEKMQWCRANEGKIWGFFVSKKMLYTKDEKEIFKYIGDAPFTKGFPEESPGRLGAWTGWQIVRAYMGKENDVTVDSLFRIRDSQKILSISGYRPEK